VAPGLIHHLVEKDIVVARIMMEKNQLLDVAIASHPRRLQPGAMAPPALRLILSRRILRIENQNLCILGILAQHPVQVRVAMLQIAGVNDDRTILLHPVSGGSLGMIQGEGMNGQSALPKGRRTPPGVLLLRRGKIEVHGRIRVGHVPSEDLSDRLGFPARVKHHLSRRRKQRCEERQPLYVIPVEVGHQEAQGTGPTRKLQLQRQAEIARARPSIDDENVAWRADFDAGGVSTVTEILDGGRGDRAADTPEL
jgi:hypothetical protein